MLLVKMSSMETKPHVGAHATLNAGIPILTKIRSEILLFVPDVGVRRRAAANHPSKCFG